MTPQQSCEEFFRLKLSLSERILWAEALWNSVTGDKSSVNVLEISDEHKKIPEDELASYKRNPTLLKNMQR